MSTPESIRDDARHELEYDALVERYWVAAEYVAEGIHHKRCGPKSPHGRVAALRGDHPCGHVYQALTSIVAELDTPLMQSFVARSGVNG